MKQTIMTLFMLISVCNAQTRVISGKVLAINGDTVTLAECRFKVQRADTLQIGQTLTFTSVNISDRKNRRKVNSKIIQSPAIVKN